MRYDDIDNCSCTAAERFSPAVAPQKEKERKNKEIWFYARFSACKYLGYTGKALGYIRPNIGSSAGQAQSLNKQKGMTDTSTLL